MKIFDRDGKTNFVDENNVFLGYDSGQCCCERAGWFVANSLQDRLPEIEIQDILEEDKYTFDTTFFQQVVCSDLDEGGMVVFRIVNGCKEKYLHLFNVHNGYYGHGFTFTVGEKIAHEGTL